MDLLTNHLIEMSEREIAAGYRKVPPELEHAAQQKLAVDGEVDQDGVKGAHVSFKSGGKLSTWAAKKRKEEKAKKKNRSKAKTARKSRRK